MTESEKWATAILRKEEATTVAENQTFTSVEQRLAKRRKISVTDEEYVDCRFVLGSSAECERLFSMAQYTFCENRRSMLSIVLESILFFKLNELFWDAGLVSGAINSGRTRNNVEISKDWVGSGR